MPRAPASPRPGVRRNRSGPGVAASSITVARRTSAQALRAMIDSVMASTIPYPSRVSPPAPSLASRWRMSLSRTNGRSNDARAGTSLAGIAGSSGR